MKALTDRIDAIAKIKDIIAEAPRLEIKYDRGAWRGWITGIYTYGLDRAPIVEQASSPTEVMHQLHDHLCAGSCYAMRTDCTEMIVSGRR